MGNSGAKAAVFRDCELISPILRFSYQEWELADELATNHSVRNIVYSSVTNVPPQEMIDKWKNEQRRVISLAAGQPLAFPSLYATPETLGQDRIAAIMAFQPKFLPAAAPLHQPSRLIVDAGTCVTMDLLDESGTHRGGNISPGLRMRLQAMHTFTAKLPFPEPASPAGEAGLSTVEALRHGAQLGLVYELEGLYNRLLHRYPGLEVILTGGDGEWLSKQLSIPCSFRPNLVLFGLLQLMSTYERNES